MTKLTGTQLQIYFSFMGDLEVIKGMWPQVWPMNVWRLSWCISLVNLKSFFGFQQYLPIFVRVACLALARPHVISGCESVTGKLHQYQTSIKHNESTWRLLYCGARVVLILQKVEQLKLSFNILWWSERIIVNDIILHGIWITITE